MVPLSAHAWCSEPHPSLPALCVLPGGGCSQGWCSLPCVPAGGHNHHPARTGLCDGGRQGSFLPPHCPRSPPHTVSSFLSNSPRGHIPSPPRGVSGTGTCSPATPDGTEPPRWHGPGLGHSPDAWTCPNGAASQVGSCHQQPGLEPLGPGASRLGESRAHLSPGAVVTARHRTVNTSSGRGQLNSDVPGHPHCQAEGQGASRPFLSRPSPHNLGGLCPQNAVRRAALPGGSCWCVGVLTKLSVHTALCAFDTVALSVCPCVVGPGVWPQSAGSG